MRPITPDLQRRIVLKQARVTVRVPSTGSGTLETEESFTIEQFAEAGMYVHEGYSPVSRAKFKNLHFLEWENIKKVVVKIDGNERTFT